MFSGLSNYSDSVDWAFLFIFGWGFVLLFGITAFIIYCCIRFNRSKNPTPVNIPGHFWLETTWTVLPTILVLIMFQFGYEGYKQMRTLPAEYMTVVATGKKWSWNHEYANGKLSKYLNVPVNKAVKLVLKSKDVLHSYYIPSFRIKQDVVPGRAEGKETWLWFTPQKTGIYDVYCAEYCGDEHSRMLSKVVVMEQGDYDAWEKKIDRLGGKQLVDLHGCSACHTQDGKAGIGPTWKGLFNSERKILKGGKEQTLKADETYLKNSISKPNDEIVVGFKKDLMPEIAMSEQDTQAIVDFLKTLK